MTVNGTAQMTEEATVYFCGLDLFVQVQLLKESPVVPSLGNNAQKTALRMNASRSAITSHQE